MGSVPTRFDSAPARKCGCRARRHHFCFCCGHHRHRSSHLPGRINWRSCRLANRKGERSAHRSDRRFRNDPGFLFWRCRWQHPKAGARRHQDHGQTSHDPCRGRHRALPLLHHFQRERLQTGQESDLDGRMDCPADRVCPHVREDHRGSHRQPRSEGFARSTLIYGCRSLQPNPYGIGVPATGSSDTNAHPVTVAQADALTYAVAEGKC